MSAGVCPLWSLSGLASHSAACRGLCCPQHPHHQHPPHYGEGVGAAAATLPLLLLLLLLLLLGMVVVEALMGRRCLWLLLLLQQR